jgi:multiple sugar transport system substrate-binding protein
MGMSERTRVPSPLRWRRRSVLRLGLIAAGVPGVLAVVGAARRATARAAARHLTMAYDAVQFWQDQAKEFTEKTGIPFTYEAVPFPQLHDKYLASFMSGGHEYDLVHVRDDYVAEWAPKGWLDALDARITPAMTQQNFPGAFGYLSSGGKVYGVPRYIWLWQFYYNVELFEKAGIKDPPRTWDEVRAMARKLTKPPQYGFIAPLGGFLSVNIYTIRLRAEGGDLMKAGKPAFNTPEGVRALQSLVDLVKDGSVEPSSFELPTTTEMTDVLTQGRVAMAASTPPTLAMASDATKSKVVGKIAVALIPGSKLRSAGLSELGAVGITNTSEDKDAAWEYVKFVTSMEQQKKMALAIGRIPTYPALLRDPDVQRRYPAAALAAEQMKYPMGMPVVVPQQAEVNTVIANELVAALRGKKPVERALEDAERATLRVLKG